MDQMSRNSNGYTTVRMEEAFFPLEIQKVLAHERETSSTESENEYWHELYRLQHRGFPG